MNVGDKYKYVGNDPVWFSYTIEIVNPTVLFAPLLFEYKILQNPDFTYFQDLDWLKNNFILIAFKQVPTSGYYSLNLPAGFTLPPLDFLQGVSQQSIDEMSQFEIKTIVHSCECGTSKVYGSNVDKSMHSSYCPINKN